MKKRVTLPAGTYYIGDPCYVFEGSWSKIIEVNNYFENRDTIINGVKCLISPTHSGDGTYYDNGGNQYAVDSGTLGILPIELLDLDKVHTVKSIADDGLMHIHTFDKDFVAYVNDGYFEFGNLTIDTVYDDEDDYDDNWEYDDEEDYEDEDDYDDYDDEDWDDDEY